MTLQEFFQMFEISPMKLNFTNENKNYVNFTVSELLERGVGESVVVEACKQHNQSQIDLRRWQVESGGTQINGMSIKTDEASQSKIANTLTSLQRGTISTVDFKAESGWIKVDLSSIEVISDAVILHVQKCYSVERVVHEKLDGLNTLSDIDAFDIDAEWNRAWEAA